jgi:hypothetical protein
MHFSAGAEWFAAPGATCKQYLLSKRAVRRARAIGVHWRWAGTVPAALPKTCKFVMHAFHARS